MCAKQWGRSSISQNEPAALVRLETGAHNCVSLKPFRRPDILSRFFASMARRRRESSGTHLVPRLISALSPTPLFSSSFFEQISRPPSFRGTSIQETRRQFDASFSDNKRRRSNKQRKITMQNGDEKEGEM